MAAAKQSDSPSPQDERLQKEEPSQHEPKSSSQGERSTSAEAAASSGNPKQVLHIRDNNANATYANFFKVASTPEEVILDMGINPSPFATGEVTVNVGQRVIMSHFTAKRLLTALSITLQRHEQAFGPLETDVRKRVKSQ